MSHTLLTTGNTRVSARIQAADVTPSAVLVLGHGAGANMDHAHMQAIADALGQVGITTVRFNFPYMEAGRNRTDSQSVCADTFAAAIALARQECPNLPLLIGGHSFGGRMSSHFAAEREANLSGLVYFSFPLHASKRPETKRADHLYTLAPPQLFLSGTRDTLAELPLLRTVTSRIPRGTLHELDTADHGFKILKRTRSVSESIYDEAARITRRWIDAQIQD